jgi:lipid-binding SYLF domain-containing protein
MHTTGIYKISALLLAWVFSLSAVAASSGDIEREQAQKMRTEVLERLYREQPGTRTDIQNAAGYAVFSSVGVHIVFLSGAGGTGIAHDNRSGKDTYMNMAAAGVGLGLGIKDFRAVFVFHTPAAYKNFIEKGWDFSGQADAAAKSTGRGNEGSVAATAIPNVTVYQLTETGVALQASLQGTKYWTNNKLNNPYR